MRFFFNGLILKEKKGQTMFNVKKWTIFFSLVFVLFPIRSLGAAESRYHSDDDPYQNGHELLLASEEDGLNRLSEETGLDRSFLQRMWQTVQGVYRDEPKIELVSKTFFWVINILAGASHLQGAENGLIKLFPQLPKATAANLSIPFKIADASSHVSSGIIGSNLMVKAIVTDKNFWHENASFVSKCILTIVTTYFVATSEVGSLYRNYTNNAGESQLRKIINLCFYVFAHTPEVFASMLMAVRDFYNSRAIDSEEVSRSEVGREEESQHLLLDLPAAPDEEEVPDVSDINRAVQNYSSLISRELIAADVHPKPKWIPLFSKVLAWILMPSVLLVKGMSSIKGFETFIPEDLDPLSITLGTSGALATAYFQGVLPEDVINRVLTKVYGRIAGIDFGDIRNPILHRRAPALEKAFLVTASVLACFTFPGSFNSASGSIPESWGVFTDIIVWSYVIHFFFITIAAVSELLGDITEPFVAHWR